MHSNLVLVFTSPDRPGIVERLTTVVVQHGGNWIESRLTRLGGDFAGLALVSVAEARQPELTTALLDLQGDGLHIHVKPAQPEDTPADTRLHQLTLTGADHEGIVHRVTSHLAAQQINVEEMETSVELAPTTGTPLFNMHCRLRLPDPCDCAALEQQLSALADELSVDIQLSG